MGGLAKSYEARTQFSDAGNSLTLSAADLGTADAARRVAVLIGARFNGTGSFATLTINGQSGAIHVQDGTSRSVMIGSALVPTGATGNIVVTLSGTTLRSNGGIYAAVYPLYNCDYIQSASDNNGTSDTSLNAALTGVGVGNYLLGIAQGTGGSVGIGGAGLANNAQVNGSEESAEVADNFNAAGGSMTANGSNCYAIAMAEFG